MSAAGTAGSKKVGMDLTQGPIMNSIIAFALPIVLTNIVQQLYALVDLMVIGHYMGSIGTVGVSTGGEVADLVTPVATSFATAGQIYMAQLTGAKKTKEIKTAVGTLITAMLVLSLVLGAGTIAFSRPVLHFLNCPEEAMGEAMRYMIITGAGYPFIFMYNAVCGSLRGMGESKRPLYFICVAATINIFLDILFVAVLRMGSAGTAVATVMAQAGSFAAAFHYMYQRKERFDFELKLSYLRVDPHALRIILSQAIPQIIRTTAVHFSMLWVNAGVNSYGLTASATNSVGNKIQKFLQVFVISVTQASGAIVGQNLGAGKKERAAKVAWYTFRTTFAIACVLGAVSWLVPRQVFGIFTNDPAVIDYGVVYMHIITIHYFTSAFTASFQSAITGSGFATFDLFIGLLDGIICRVGLSILFAYILRMGATGFFWATALTRVIPGCIVFAYFISGKWKERKLLTV
ncbi:MAG: MATE family efflux transporter [Stomatobaculum sp.]|nr:MATE family efflux transporter [Stomatobaculum sp.]